MKLVFLSIVPFLASVGATGSKSKTLHEPGGEAEKYQKVRDLQNTYQLLAAGSASSCDAGYAVLTATECSTAAASLGIQFNVQTITDSQFPCGCMTEPTRSAFFNDASSCSIHRDQSLICNTQQNPYYLIPKGTASSCDAGYAVLTATECSTAAASVGAQAAVTTYESASNIPCGCSTELGKSGAFNKGGSCSTHRDKSVICRSQQNPYYLIPKGTASSCDAGYAVLTASECVTAALSLGIQFNVQTKTDSQLPCGCMTEPTRSAFFNDATSCSIHRDQSVICHSQQQMTNSPTPSPTPAPTPVPTTTSTTAPQEGSVRGDPDFTTWSGKKYDFHGICDLIMLSNPGFANDMGMEIHIRTKGTRQWSFTSAVVVRIGSETIEVMGGTGKNRYWINGVKGDESDDSKLLSSSISGYPIKYKINSPKSREFMINLGKSQAIEIKTWNGFVSVHIEGATSEDFGSSLGLMGAFGTGLFMSRNNSTVINDINDFGREWQVLASEPMLFHEVDENSPQAPQACVIPSTVHMRRRLSKSLISKEDAEVACSRVDAESFDLCVFYVMATNDKDIAGAY